MLKKFFLYLVVLVFCSKLPSLASATEINLVAFVGENAITSYDVDLRVKSMKALNIIPDKAKDSEVYKAAIDSLIDDYIKGSVIQKSSIAVLDEEITEYLNSLKENNQKTYKTIMEIKKTDQVLYLSITEQMKKELLWSKFISSQISPSISVTQYEVEVYMKTNYGVNQNVAKNNIFLSKVYLKAEEFVKKIKDTMYIEIIRR